MTALSIPGDWIVISAAPPARHRQLLPAAPIEPPEESVVPSPQLRERALRGPELHPGRTALHLAFRDKPAEVQ
jgi:hypothetical protein